MASLSDDPAAGARDAGGGASKAPGGGRPVSDPAAVADILASIRSIVADDASRSGRAPVVRSHRSGTLLLTPDMRVDVGGVAAPPTPGTPDGPAADRREGPLGADPGLRPGAGGTARTGEDAIADIVRDILREEIEGEFGARVVARVRALASRDASGAPEGRGESASRPEGIG